MKITTLAFATILSAIPLTAAAGPNLSVGQIACYDRIGPFNVIGTIMDRKGDKVLLQSSNGKQKWYPARKFRNVLSCKLTKEAIDWAVNKGVDLASQ